MSDHASTFLIYSLSALVLIHAVVILLAGAALLREFWRD